MSERLPSGDSECRIAAMQSLAAAIAHDLNNILGPILGYSQLAWYDLPENSPVRSHLDQVLQAGKRARTQLQRILAFSGKFVVEQHPLTIQTVLEGCLAELRSSLPSTIEITEAVDHNCNPIMGNESQVREVVMNLCANAAHAMKAKSEMPPQERGSCILGIQLEEVEIAPEASAVPKDLEPGNYVKLSITDTGHGMDEETQKRLFEPYFTTMPKGQGTGLGLAEVYGIVMSCGGHVAFESEVGISSRFDLYFPVCSVADDINQAELMGCFRGASEHLLLVDDEEFILEVTKDFLERIGYRVTTCTNGEKALAIIQQGDETFDLIMTDQAMPSMTGTELAAKLISLRKEIPIILCTGYGETLSREKARNRGIVEFLNKPVVLPDLARTLRRVLAGDKRSGASE